MIIYHIYLKHLQSQRKLPDFDVKLTILSCLRISAVINDLELKQESYAKVYYDSVIQDEDRYTIFIQRYQPVGSPDGYGKFYLSRFIRFVV